MSEDSPFDRLLGRFSRRPEKGSMNEHERRADGMAEDLRSSLNRALPKDPHYGYTPVQWAVRTSMKEIENFRALDQTIRELQENELKELARQIGKSVDELRRHYRDMGDKADIESTRSAYVIVECNIDHRNLDNPFETAQIFLKTLNGKVNRHNPDSEEISSDELTPLSRGQRLRESGALFEAKYTFGSR